MEGTIVPSVSLLQSQPSVVWVSHMVSPFILRSRFFPGDGDSLAFGLSPPLSNAVYSNVNLNINSVNSTFLLLTHRS